MSPSDERLGGQRLHWMIAWRHLRVGDSAPTFVVPLMCLSAYLILIGAGLALVASLGSPEVVAAAEEVVPLVPEITAGAAAPAPIESYYALIGGGTLFVGVMLLIGALLSRIFTLLATVIIISVMLGCMALVVVLSLMTGLEHELRDKILGQLSHIQIAREDHRPFGDYDPVIQEIAEIPGIEGVSPYLKGEVMVRNGLNRQGGILTGIIPEREATVSYLPTILTAGKYDYLDHPEEIPEPSFSFEVARDDNITKVKKKGVGLGISDALPKPKAGSTLPPPVDLPMEVPAGQDDSGWEDPEIELQNLRGEGASAKGSAMKGAVDIGSPDDSEEPDDISAVIANYGLKGPLKPDGVQLGLPTGAAFAGARIGRPTAEENDGWEDPEDEIPKLREAGVLPPAPEVEEPIELAENQGSATVPASSEAKARPEPVTVLAPVLIGSEKARELVASLGDRVQLITPIGRQTPVGRMPGRMDVRVAGVFDANHYEYDRWLLYAPLETVQSFLRTGDRISGIEIRVDDLDKIGERKRTLQEVVSRLGRDDIVVRDWQELNASLFSAMALEKIAVFIALLCVILVASFGILGSNLMSVLEKSKEIAILKTMGTSDSLIQRIFIAEGLCLGILGAVIGIGTGIGLCVVLDSFGLPLSGNLGDFETLPVAVDPVEVLLVGVSALIIVWLSSLYPARVASRMRPVQALRKAEA